MFRRLTKSDFEGIGFSCICTPSGGTLHLPQSKGALVVKHRSGNEEDEHGEQEQGLKKAKVSKTANFS